MSYPDWVLNGRMVVFDVETTGFDPSKDRVIEVGLIWIEDGEKVMDFSTLLDPGVEVSSLITEITGIHQKDLVGQPQFSMIRDFIADLFVPPCVLVAYNSLFDIRFLKLESELCGKDLYVPESVVDPLKWVRSEDVGSCKLAAAAGRRGIKPSRSHRALSDCHTTLELLGKIALPSSLGDTLEKQKNLRRRSKK